ncbi:MULTISPECIES: NADPH-dependent FMN reductase [unclassified Leifsonia]|jgi:NAD(P)H-dependent FMN reductase|uniref:NADPH-dependent FMN reductase n=1 Tax=unclassified Leifsonia TaxID=2663824 RepID=UPI00087D0AB2|nr:MULTISPECIES: NAD(P)H-dependent oxidoreductase [unclassified Leifsonia]MDR6610667.1 NAD(P)H-dependent FMN reductase [Leifsonia sp. 1010]SDH58789.1 NAD(P)H-dependent FMN reductase [Leifsonia sp. 197AMF]SDI80437.1 NAD(P)H-dependent FMN reductase [Leifsonia sp. 466MF]SDK04758.1 NAD(P)H-dependent FMN reductase [Leifsonia sp. 157MF]SDN83859.1 NAD(P)H-dependent FMN reductase [Leifsonia sp. 509MF]
MTKIAIIIGSTRPGRNGEAVARWVYENAAKRSGVEYELVDLKDWDLPHLDEAMPAAMGQYAGEHTKAWAAKIAEFDGFVFVTPEYNHSTSGALKNAIDYVGAEWYNKAAGFVSYGVFGGARAVEHLRLVLSQLQVATVSAHVGLSLAHDFENWQLKPTEQQTAALTPLFDQVEAWSAALETVRTGAAAEQDEDEAAA